MNDQPTRTWLPATRQGHILAAIERDGAVQVSQLIEELGVAPVTARRDLAQLEDEGLLVRVHGGAVAPNGSVFAQRDVEKTRPEGSIAVLVPSLNYYWPGVIRGIENAARTLGFRVLLRGASYELQDERPVLQRLVRDEQVRGLIVAPNTDTQHAQDVIQWLAECGVPSVLIERDAHLFPSFEPVESVSTDHAHGALLAARHLAGLGHQRVGLVLSRFSPTSRKIAAGWSAGCAELGLSTAEQLEPLLPDRSSPDFSATVDAILDDALSRGMTGLLVHSDPEAMAFVDLALNRGIAVPRDLSVIAYDDEVAQLFSPALTAVSPPRNAVGEAALMMLAERLRGSGHPKRRVIFSPELKIRESTAPPRSS